MNPNFDYNQTPKLEICNGLEIGDSRKIVGRI